MWGPTQSAIFCDFAMHTLYLLSQIPTPFHMAFVPSLTLSEMQEQFCFKKNPWKRPAPTHKTVVFPVNMHTKTGHSPEQRETRIFHKDQTTNRSKWAIRGNGLSIPAQIASPRPRTTPSSAVHTTAGIEVRLVAGVG